MISRDNDIANELQEIIPGAAWAGLTPTFGEVPAGYFEQLPAKIMQKIELEEISPLLSEIPKTFPLSAPEGYFERLSGQIMQKIELEEISPLLAELPKTFPLSAPEGYFEQLSAQILNKVQVQDELESISPLLSGIPKAFPLSAPEGYFDQLTANILADIQAPAKVVPMRPRRTYLKWASAACLIAIISTGTLFFMQNRQKIVTPVEENALADVSDQEIVEYLQTHMDAFDKEELLSLASVNITTTGTVALPETSELSSEAIQRYLDNTGSF